MPVSTTANAPAPYTAVCSSEVTYLGWDCEKMNVLEPVFSGLEGAVGCR